MTLRVIILSVLDSYMGMRTLNRNIILVRASEGGVKSVAYLDGIDT